LFFATIIYRLLSTSPLLSHWAKKAKARPKRNNRLAMLVFWQKNTIHTHHFLQALDE
jgi:hypothetical protein